MTALVTALEPIALITEGEGIDLLNSLQRKFLTREETLGILALANQGDINIRPSAGKYSSFTFTITAVKHGSEIELWMSFYGRAFAIINRDNVVFPAPCESSPEDTVRFWEEGTVDILLEQLRLIIPSNAVEVLSIA